MINGSNVHTFSPKLVLDERGVIKSWKDGGKAIPESKHDSCGILVGLRKRGILLISYREDLQRTTVERMNHQSGISTTLMITTANGNPGPVHNKLLARLVL